jgi:hypothetical protein
LAPGQRSKKEEAQRKGRFHCRYLHVFRTFRALRPASPGYPMLAFRPSVRGWPTLQGSLWYWQAACQKGHGTSGVSGEWRGSKAK